MSDENHIAIVSRMAAVLCGRGGGRGAKARRRAARRAWALYAEVHAMHLDGIERLTRVPESDEIPEPAESHA